MKRGVAFITSSQLLSRIAPVLDGTVTVPLLVVQLPEFAEIAWRRNTRAARRVERATSAAFYRAARRVVREEDILAHDCASDWFAVAMLAPSRDGAHLGAVEARSALERIRAGIAAETGSRMRTGWYPLNDPSECSDMNVAISRALERGAIERERYEFLATVGHELRTPLTSIRGYIETLLDGDVDARTTRRFLETARNEALRLGRLVDGMLDFSLLDLSPAAAVERNSDPAEIARAATDALAPVAASRGIAVRSALRVGLSARIAPDACMHAVVNLVENALKYGREGGRVEISVHKRDTMAAVCVEDDGSGVPEHEREAIFALRARGASVPPAPGRGIGLTIVRTIAERVGGRVWAEGSTLGGARFVLEIPLAHQPHPAELALASS